MTHHLQFSSVPLLRDFTFRPKTMVVVWVGEVTGQEWDQRAKELVVTPEFSDVRDVLADLTRWNVDPSLDLTTIFGVARILGEQARSVMSGLRLALVASGGFISALHFEHRVEELGANAVVFRELDNACVWLGLDPAVTASHIGGMLASA